jgi:hypothetical protein
MRYTCIYKLNVLFLPNINCYNIYKAFKAFSSLKDLSYLNKLL